MASFKGTTRQNFDGAYSEALDLSTPTDSPGLEWAQAWAAGTGDQQANRLFHDQKAISSIDTLDLTGGLTDAFGNTLTFAKIKELWIKNTSTTSGEDLQIAGNWFLTKVLRSWVDDGLHFLLPRGGAIRWASPYEGFPVTASSGDALTITPATGTITYQIVILGTE